MFFLNKCRNWLNERPLILIVVVEAVNQIFPLFFIGWAINFCLSLGIISNIKHFVYVYGVICSTICAFFLAWLFGYLGIYRFKNFFKTLKITFVWAATELLFLVFSICNVILSNLEFANFFQLILGFLYMLAIGFSEETVFSGLFLNCLVNKWGTTRKNVLICVLVGAFIFGLHHLSNILYGVNVVSCLIQAIEAFAYFLISGVIYLQGGCLWIPMILHAIHDVSAMFKIYFVKLDKVQDMSFVINSYNFWQLLLCVSVYVLLAWAAFNKKSMDEVVSRVKLKLQNCSK